MRTHCPENHEPICIENQSLWKNGQTITTLKNEVKTLKEKQDEYEQFHRRKIVCMFGLPEAISSNEAMQNAMYKTPKL